MKEHRKNPAVDNKGDENVVNLVYKIYPFLQFRFSLLNNQYNVGCTQFESRYNSAIKPINVGAFKPDEFDGINKFIDKNLVSSELRYHARRNTRQKTRQKYNIPKIQTRFD